MSFTASQLECGFGMEQLDANKVVVAASTAAAEISNAGHIAKQLSLVAKNARTVVLRAGDAALGFKVVSDFFVELSTSSIFLVSQVNIVAIELSRGAIECWDANRLSQKLDDVVLRHKEEEIEYFSSIEPSISKGREGTAKLNDDLKHQIKKLSSLVDYIPQQMRAGKVISVISRIEASRAGEFRQALEEMADKVEALTERMIVHIQTAMTQLEEAQVNN